MAISGKRKRPTHIENTKRARAKTEGSEGQDALKLLDKEIEDLKKRPDSPETKVLLASALARKQGLEGKSRDAPPIKDTTNLNVSETHGDGTAHREANDSNAGKQTQDDEMQEEQTENNREDAKDSTEGKVAELDQADDSTEKIIHDIPWHISPMKGLSSGNGHPVPIGYRKKGSGKVYLVRYGTAESCSTRFESSPESLPQDPETSLTDVACEGSRIIERIIAWHRKNRQPLPDDVLSKAQILNVYWDTKKTLGVDVEDDLNQSLGPSPPSRTSVRCVVYLDPKLYAEKNWGVNNLTGLSHETRTTMLTCINGISREDKEIELFNVAVKLENRYQRRFQPARTSLRPYARPPSVRLNTPRRKSPRRTPVRQPVCVEESDEVSEESSSEDERFDEPDFGYPRKEQSSKISRQETPPITEDALGRIMDKFATDIESRIMKQLQDTLVDQITEKVMERIRDKNDAVSSGKSN